MTKGSRLLSLLLLVSLSGCIADPERPYAPEDPKAPTPFADRGSSYTLLQAIFIDDEKVGYLFTYLEVPPVSTIPEIPAAGTRFIQNLNFKNLGFIMPQGTTYRYGENNQSVEVCQFTLSKNLAYFFGKPFSQVVLRDLE